MTTFNITHATTDQTLNMATKKDLRDAMPFKGNSTLTKTELVAHARNLRDKLREQHDAVEAVKAQARQEVIDHEIESGMRDIIFQALLNRLDVLMETQTKHIERFTERAKASPSAVVSCFEEALDAEHCLRSLRTLVCFVQEQNHPEQCDLTLQEFADRIRKEHQMMTRSLMRDVTFRHNSTCAIRNVENQSEFRAKQYMARLYATMIQALDHDLGNTEAVQNGYVYCAVVDDYAC